MSNKNFGSWFDTHKKFVAFLCLFCTLGLLFSDLTDYYQHLPKRVTYREYMDTLEAGMDVLDEDGTIIEVVPDLIDTVYYNPDADTWRYTLWTEDSRAKYQEWIDSGKEAAKFQYDYAKKDWRYFEMPDYTNDMLQAHIEQYDGLACREVVKRSFEPLFIQLLPVIGSTILMFAFLFGFLMFYSKKMASMGGIGKDLLVKDTGKRFEDVIGLDEVIGDLQLIVKLMQASKERLNKKSPSSKESAIDRFDADIPRGMLFSGPPGTGKTLLAKAIAGEAGIPFLYMNASGFVEMYVGVGAKRVRELFKIARKNAPCIIFIDEIDAVGTDRSANVSGEVKQTVNALLQEMDGFDSRAGIFIIAATNNPDALDKALVRSGRFDRQVVINPPRDYKVRMQMFEMYLGKDAEGVDLEHIAKQCVGFTGADISTVCNEARLIAITQDAKAMTTEFLEEAVDRKIFKGNRIKSHEKHSEDMKITAYHEAGHALMNTLLGIPVSRATIVGTTSGVGGAVFKEDDMKESMSKQDILDTVMSFYGGRAAEEAVFGKEHITTGASNDIEKGTAYLKEYVLTYGFDEDKTGIIAMSVLKNELSDRDIQRIKDLSKELYTATLTKLNENRKKLDTLAKELLEKETLTGDEIIKLLA